MGCADIPSQGRREGSFRRAREGPRQLDRGLQPSGMGVPRRQSSERRQFPLLPEKSNLLWWWMAEASRCPHRRHGVREGLVRYRHLLRIRRARHTIERPTAANGNEPIGILLRMRTGEEQIDSPSRKGCRCDVGRAVCDIGGVRRRRGHTEFRRCDRSGLVLNKPIDRKEGTRAGASPLRSTGPGHRVHAPIRHVLYPAFPQRRKMGVDGLVHPEWIRQFG